MKSRLSGLRWGAPCFYLLTVLVLAPSLFAKDKNKPANTAANARVIAHLPLEGATPRQLFIQSQDNRQFLYVDQGVKQGYTIVDVTQPSHPTVVKRVEGGKLQAVGSGIVVTETPDNGTSSSSPHTPATRTVKVIDTSDPANPRTIQTFTGVTSVVQDSGRNLLYLTNDEGLWIVSHPPQRLEPERRKPPCTSESAIQAMPPDCE